MNWLMKERFEPGLGGGSPASDAPASEPVVMEPLSDAPAPAPAPARLRLVNTLAAARRAKRRWDTRLKTTFLILRDATQRRSTRSSSGARKSAAAWRWPLATR